MSCFTFRRIAILLSILGFVQLRAQLSGTITVPGTYTSLAAALNAINTQGVNGPLFVQLAAGYTETAPVGGFSLNATGTSTAPIIFEKSGAGSNPLLTAFTGTATPASAVQDGIWRFIGSDYVTVNGIDLADPNTTNPGTMEYGFGFFKVNGTNGCQNNTITNCTITLRTVNNASGAGPSVEGSRGINVVNAMATAQTSNLVPSGTAGANSFNVFTGNLISGCNIGIALIGYAAPSPFTLADTDNQVGGPLAAKGNTIINFGGAAAASNAAAAVRTLAQYNLVVSSNFINNLSGGGVAHPNTLRGIFINTAVSAAVTVAGNTLNLVSGATTGTLAAIENLSGATAAGNTLVLQNNIISSCSFTGNTTGSFYGIYNNGATAGGLVMSNNTFSNINTAGTTGSNFLLYNSAAISGPVTMTGNLVSACTHTSTGSGHYFGIFNAGAVTGSLSLNNNTITGVNIIQATGAINLLYNTGAATAGINLGNNVLTSLSTSVTSSGTLALVYNNAASTTSLNLSNISISNYTAMSGSGATHLIYNRGALSNTFALVQMNNNLLSGCTFSSTGGGPSYLLYNNGVTATVVSVNNNTVTQNTWQTTTSLRYLLSNWGVNSSASMNGNLLSNCSSNVNGTGQLQCIYNNNPNAVSGGSLFIQQNTLTALSFSSSTGDIYQIHSQGVSSNTFQAVQISDNVITAVTQSVSSSGAQYGIYNNAASAQSLSITRNSVSSCTVLSNSGSVFHLYNRGAAGNLFGVMTMSGNVLGSLSYSSNGSGAIYGLFNSGVSTATSAAVNIISNTIAAGSYTQTNAAVNLLVNATPVTGDLNITGNLLSQHTNTLNTSGSFTGLQNSGAVSGNILIGSNTLTALSSSATNGARYHIYNTGAAAGTVFITSNFLSALTHTSGSGANLFHIINGSATGGGLSVTGNTLSACSGSMGTGSAYMIYNSSAVSNVIGTLAMDNNLVTNVNYAGTSGSFFGVFNNLISTPQGGINSNTISNITLSGTTGNKILVCNSGTSTGTINIGGNLVSAITCTANTTGGIYPVYNTGAITGSLSMRNNIAGTIQVAATTGSVFGVYNVGVVQNSINIANNLVQQFTFSTTGSAVFSAVQNNAGSASQVSITQNTVTSSVITASTGASHLLGNRGAAGAVISNLLISDNTVNNISLSTGAGSVTAIMNNATSCGALGIVNNTVTAVSISGTNTPRVFVYNTGSITSTGLISANTVSQIASSFSTSILNGAIINTGLSAGDLTISNNRISSYTLSSTASSVSIISNSAQVAGLLSISSNSVSQVIAGMTGSGNFSGILNASAGTGSISMGSNSFLNSTVTAVNNTVALMVNTRTIAAASNSCSIISNSLSGIQVSGCSAFYALQQSAVNAVNTDFSANVISAANVSVSTGPAALIFSSAAHSGALGFSGNNLQSNTLVIPATNTCLAIGNSGTLGQLVILSNTISGQVNSGPAAELQYIINTGSVSGSASYSANLLTGNQQLSAGSGNLRLLSSYGGIGGDLSVSSNTLLNNMTAGYSGSVTLIQNEGSVAGQVSISGNLVSQQFSATVNGFASDLYGILNNGGSATSSLAVTQNTFTGFIYGTAAGGELHFIRNNYTHTVTTVSSNVWSALNLNHSGTQELMYNEGCSGLLTVSGNSISGGYTRNASAGNLYLFASGISTLGTAIQQITGNSFTGITANQAGSGSFYGIYSKDGASQKMIDGNIISSVNYNSAGYMYLISADRLGNDTSSLSSSVSNNTVSNIVWQGPLLAIEAGPVISSSVSAMVNANTVLSMTANAGLLGMTGIYATSAGAGLKCQGNKIAGLREISGMAILHGMNIINSSTTQVVNNIIGDLVAVQSGQSEAVQAMRIQGVSLAQVYYNTINLSGIITGTNSGSNALNVAENVNLDLRNNIIINTSTPAGNGRCSALRRTGPALASYLTTSGNNIFYSGIPSPGRSIYFDAANTYSVIGTFLSAVSPRETNSFYDNPVFLSTVPSSTAYLHLDPQVQNYAESNAAAIAGFTTDIDSDLRQGAPGYAGTGTAPDIGADEFNQALIACAGASAGTISSGSGTVICAGQQLYLYSTGFSTNGNIQHQWKQSSTAGGPYTSITTGVGFNRSALTTPTLGQGTYYFVLVTTCTTGMQTSTSNELTVTVNPAPGASAAITPTAICAGRSVTMSAQSSAGASFLWTGPVSYSNTASTAIISAGNTSVAGVYTVTTTKQGCSSQATVNVAISVSPPAFTLSPATTSICAGSSQTVTASIPLTTPTLVVGSQSGQNAANAYPAPYSAYYGGQKMQFLVLAGELSGAGFTSGTPLTGISFPVVSLGSGWGSNIQFCQNFRISVKSTTVNNLTVFENNMSVVYASTNYTPVTGYGNTHVFQNPFVWDGQSNLVIETAFSNSIIGSSATSVIQNHSGTGFQSTLVFRADNLDFNALASASNSNVSVGYVRPDFRLTGISVGNYVWPQSPVLSQISASQAIVTPTQSGVFTSSLSNGVCESSNSFSIQVYNVPQVSISAVSTSVCVGNSTTLQVSGANNYLWSSGSTATSIVVSPQSSAVYSVQGSNGICPNGTATISVLVLPPLAVTLAVTPSVICGGQTTTVSATGALTYSWNGGQTTPSISVTPSVNTTYTVTAFNGPGCRTTRNITVRVNPAPVVVLSSSNPTVCTGQEVKLTAGGAASYTWQNSGQTGNSILVYPTANVIYTVQGKDLNSCLNTATIALAVDACLGLDALQSPQIVAYPNPASDKIFLKLLKGIETDIRLLSEDGRLVHSQTAMNEAEIVLSPFARGLYMLQVSAAGERYFFKISIE